MDVNGQHEPSVQTCSEEEAPHGSGHCRLLHEEVEALRAEIEHLRALLTARD